MAILTSGDVFSKIVVVVVLNTRFIYYIQALDSNGLIVGSIPQTIVRSGLYDENSAPFIVARDALHAGTAVIEYTIQLANSQSVTYLDSELPESLQSVRSFDPLRKAYLALSRVPSNVGPANLILYKYIEVAAGEDQPSAPALPTDPFDGDVEDLQDHYEALGWYLHTHDAMTNMPTGSPSLYYLIVNYFWDGSTSVGELSVAILGIPQIPTSD